MVKIERFALNKKLLCQPNIPKPLHGVNMRTIKGKDWWDKVRQEAYARYGYRCIACGVHKTKAKYKRWLEAHEDFHINYETGECKINSIEPLCHYCHNFIHSGRLFVSLVSVERKQLILQHGFDVLKDTNLKVFYNTLRIAKLYGVDTYDVHSYKPVENKNLEWKDWCLCFEGERYHSRFKDQKEWFEFYKI